MRIRLQCMKTSQYFVDGNVERVFYSAVQTPGFCLRPKKLRQKISSSGKFLKILNLMEISKWKHYLCLVVKNATDGPLIDPVILVIPAAL